MAYGFWTVVDNCSACQEVLGRRATAPRALPVAAVPICAVSLWCSSRRRRGGQRVLISTTSAYCVPVPRWKTALLENPALQVSWAVAGRAPAASCSSSMLRGRAIGCTEETRPLTARGIKASSAAACGTAWLGWRQRARASD